MPIPNIDIKKISVASTAPQNPLEIITMAPPVFSQPLSAGAQAAVASRGTPATLNLDDIFGDVMFTPDGDTVFLSEQQDDDDALLNSGEGDNVATMASKSRGDGSYAPVQKGGGLYTTQLVDSSKAALTMGAGGAGVQSTASVPYKKAPQAQHHLQYAAPKKKKSSSSSTRSADRKMSEQQKVERRYVTSGISFSRSF
jgi:hypothetical protein